jgi:hypothetical protein
VGQNEVLTALLIAARAEHQEAAALALAEPFAAMSTLALGAPPVAIELALTALSAGDLPRATAACAALHASQPTWPVTAYCDGRVADAKKDDLAAFRAYRSFLDHWVDADEEALWMRDVRHRMVPLLVRLRAPARPAR